MDKYTHTFYFFLNWGLIVHVILQSAKFIASASFASAQVSTDGSGSY